MRGCEVRAIREGRKTQTRRIIKPQPRVVHAIHNDASIETNLLFRKGDQRIHCPFGQPGDRLFVKETWAQVHPIQVLEGRFSLKGMAGIPGPPPVDYRVIYRADGEYQRIHFQDGGPKYPYRELCVDGCKRDHIHPEEKWNGWASSAFMPRWASRITLEIISVRVERLNNITEEDAKAEGVDFGFWHPQQGVFSEPTDEEDEQNSCFRDGFGFLWESIHGPGSWDANPWVWVIEFKEVKP